MAGLFVRQRLTQRLTDLIVTEGWDAKLYSIENEKPQPDPGLDFVAIEFLGGNEEQITMSAPGANIYRESGDFLIHYATRAGTGSGLVIERLEFIRDAWRGTTEADIRIAAIDPPDTTTGASLAAARGNFWGASVLIAYDYDKRGA